MDSIRMSWQCLFQELSGGIQENRQISRLCLCYQVMVDIFRHPAGDRSAYGDGFGNGIGEALPEYLFEFLDVTLHERGAPAEKFRFIPVGGAFVRNTDTGPLRNVRADGLGMAVQALLFEPLARLS